MPKSRRDERNHRCISKARCSPGPVSALAAEEQAASDGHRHDDERQSHSRRGELDYREKDESRSEEREPDDLPGPLLIAAVPILFPLNFVYWTAHGTVAGLFSGFASDLNLITGHGSIDRTWETMLVPMKTNAAGESGE